MEVSSQDLTSGVGEDELRFLLDSVAGSLEKGRSRSGPTWVRQQEPQPGILRLKWC